MDFDWGDIGRFISYLVPAVIFLGVNVFFKKQQERRRRITTVKSLLSEIDYNQRLIESIAFGWKTKKFETTTWQRNKSKLDYVDKGLYLTLADAYKVAEEFNREIDAAKKYKSTSYLESIKVDRLGEPLAKSLQGLHEWLDMNKGKKEISNLVAK